MRSIRTLAGLAALALCGACGEAPAPSEHGVVPLAGAPAVGGGAPPAGAPAVGGGAPPAGAPAVGGGAPPAGAPAVGGGAPPAGAPAVGGGAPPAGAPAVGGGAPPAGAPAVGGRAPQAGAPAEDEAPPAGAPAEDEAPPAALMAEQGLVPTPIGRGPAFQPPARAPRGEPCTPGALAGRWRAHVELFGDRQAIVIPAGIGLGPPLRRTDRYVVGAACRAAARTLDPAGVIDFDRPGLTLGELFAIWGEPLGPRRMLSFRGPVSVFVGGDRVHGDPAQLPLRDGAQIVLEVGGYIPPHRSFLFPPRP